MRLQKYGIDLSVKEVARVLAMGHWWILAAFKTNIPLRK
jgi:hypothetical protein